MTSNPVSIDVGSAVEAGQARIMFAQMQDLNGSGFPLAPDEVNPEYMRGQVELFCTVLGLDTNDYRDILTDALTGAWRADFLVRPRPRP